MYRVAYVKFQKFQVKPTPLHTRHFLVSFCQADTYSDEFVFVLSFSAIHIRTLPSSCFIFLILIFTFYIIDLLLAPSSYRSVNEPFHRFSSPFQFLGSKCSSNWMSPSLSLVSWITPWNQARHSMCMSWPTCSILGCTCIGSIQLLKFSVKNSFSDAPNLISYPTVLLDSLG